MELQNAINVEANTDMKNETSKTKQPYTLHSVNGSVFSQDEENELQRLVTKIKYKQPTYIDMERADTLTRKKWKAQGII